MDPTMKNKRKTLATHLASISETNRADVERVIQHRRGKGCRLSTLVNYAYAFRTLDAFVDGAPFASLNKWAYREFVHHIVENYAASTAYNMCACLKANLRSLLDVPYLDVDIAEALSIRQPGRGPKPGVLIRRDEFEAVLQSCTDYFRTKRAQCDVMMKCLLWMLWDTGFRITELLALNCGNVRLEANGAKLVMPDLEEGLKTGPRTIYIAEAKPMLQAWLSVHPDPSPDHALFIGLRDKVGTTRLCYNVVCKLLRRLGDMSGVNIGRDKTLSAHHFRHTLATRKVREHAWTETELKSYFGWGPSSSMPSHYVHLGLGDMRDRVLRDAGLDINGNALVHEGGESKAELLARLISELASNQHK